MPDAGCGKQMTEYVELSTGFHTKKITVRCGNTSPDGNPWQCTKCRERTQHVDWRREAELNGEAWGPEDY